ncbi:phosphorylase [Brasilonema sp. UFV-L1]|uniref:5'-methylthioadenosine/S-adenosylhomocysteine nucleosidase family protein n=1 Tax=Brasilonema sp. UFV-L1 TaxID=2234130 RepID=UPI00145DDBDA|nr:phosphorylase [Brasilonema sp. UFV-L1]NMG08500.1 phosphorylase [Brasilonema sp. UFV-L1]
MLVDAILVAQGPEYKSVCKGLNRLTISTPPVFPIPMGPSAFTKFLEQWLQAGHLSQHQQPRVLLMGLCGSLSPKYSVGKAVLYQSCIYPGAEEKKNTTELFCDCELSKRLQEKLQDRVFTGIGLTSDRLIYSASEKLQLGQAYAADVVDMEGYVALELLSRLGIAVAMLRVISDDAHHNIPNLTNAFHSDGSLRAFPLAMGLLRQPIAATRLVSGSLRGLRILQNLTTFLFSSR